MDSRTVTLAAAVALLVLGMAACTGQQPGAATSQMEEKTLAVTPPSTAIRVGFLTGELTNLKVVQRVDQETGKVVDGPRLRGTLTLKNETSDQTARLVSGRLEFLDADGKRIPLPAGPGDARFDFYSYSGDRLHPGMQTSHNLDVAFPAAALDAERLADIRVNVAYIPDPYRADSATVSVSLAR